MNISNATLHPNITNFTNVNDTSLLNSFYDLKVSENIQEISLTILNKMKYLSGLIMLSLLQFTNHNESKNPKNLKEWKKITDERGTIFQGEFVNGKLNGQGTITYLNIAKNVRYSKTRYDGKKIYWGDAYEKGHFSNNKLNGPGLKVAGNGDEDTGFFIDGRLTGTGKRVNRNREHSYEYPIYYEGLFINGEPADMLFALMH